LREETAKLKKKIQALTPEVRQFEKSKIIIKQPQRS